WPTTKRVATMAAPTCTPTAAEAMAARPRLHQQQPQLRNAALRLAAGLVARLDEEHTSGIASVELGDPAGLALGIELLDVARRDVRHQRLEPRIPAVLLGIQRTMARDDPADVARSR